MKLITLFTLALLTSAALAAPVLEYAEAKALADVDEASLLPQQRDGLRASQGILLASATAACATPKPDLSDLVVVMELDAQGKVVHTWLQGSSPLAICLRKQALAGLAWTPPRAPFYTSMELSFTK